MQAGARDLPCPFAPQQGDTQSAVCEVPVDQLLETRRHIIGSAAAEVPIIGMLPQIDGEQHRAGFERQCSDVLSRPDFDPIISPDDP